MASKTVHAFEPDVQLRVEDEESLQLYVHVRYQKSGLRIKAEYRKDDVWSLLALYLLCDVAPNSSLLYQQLKFTLSLHRL